MNEFHKKVRRALELQSKQNKTHEEKLEYKILMQDPYLYDKVEGLKQGGII